MVLLSHCISKLWTDITASSCWEPFLSPRRGLCSRYLTKCAPETSAQKMKSCFDARDYYLKPSQQLTLRHTLVWHPTHRPCRMGCEMCNDIRAGVKRAISPGSNVWHCPLYSVVGAVHPGRQTLHFLSLHLRCRALSDKRDVIRSSTEQFKRGREAHDLNLIHIDDAIIFSSNEVNDSPLVKTVDHFIKNLNLSASIHARSLYSSERKKLSAYRDLHECKIRGNEKDGT